MKNITYMSLKYMLDRPLAVLLLVLCAPFMFIFASVVLLELRAFPFMMQQRGLSLENSRFKIYKFRTMKKHSSGLKRNVKNIFEKHDLEDYVPPFCRWLRKSGLDELPQLINVIKGEMSLVGPRPFTLPDLEIIQNEDSKSYDILDKIKAKPGITGYWQVYGSRRQGVVNMVWLQKYYDLNVSFLLDVKIFLSTLPLIFLGEHTDTIVVRNIGGRNGKLVRSFSEGQ